MSIPLQPLSAEIADAKYLVRDRDGNLVDKSIDEAFDRVAKALADVESTAKLRKSWRTKFRWALENGATPAGRVMSNAGAIAHKRNTSTINCTVSGKMEDSMEGIFEELRKAAITLKAGCGIGYEFSTLRPKGAFVMGAGAATSGPMSFMDVFDKMCATVASAGGRRGAQMGTFDITHPDVVDFIRAKREDGRLRNFNLSILITNEFMDAVKNNAIHNFKWNNEIWNSIPATELWDIIMKSTYDFAEPGFILVDQVNKMNNLWFCEDIRATNPCGEQPLPPFGACLLGSINLTKFVVNPMTEDAYFDFKKYREVIRIFTRMLDNVVEINGLPLDEQQSEIKSKRRHGMGYLGLGSSMALLGIEYGSKESIEFTDEVTKILAFENYSTGAALAREKGEAPIFKECFTLTEEMLENIDPEFGFEVDQVLTGRELFATSKYFKNFKDDPEGREVLDQLAMYGCRFSHATSIAPTGTISLSLGNNASNGIEPSFSHHYYRNVIVQGESTKRRESVCSFELLCYYQGVKDGSIDNPSDKTLDDLSPEDLIPFLPSSFITADSIDPMSHIDVQAAAQKWIDSSISKTINVPTDYAYDKFKDLYMYAYDKGLKGCTTFRFNPATLQGVLVRSEDLKNTTYKFTNEEGKEFIVRGDQTVFYDGREHAANNLFDAIKEGQYGKF